MTDWRGRLPWRAISAGGIVLLGIGTAIAHLYHLVDELSSPAIVLGVVMPLVVAATLAGTGVWLNRQQLSEGAVFRVTGWMALGLIGGTAFGYPVVGYQSAHGVPLVDVEYMLLTWATTGAVTGFVVGFYDVRLRQVRRSLKAERDALSARERELERQNERLERFSSMVSHDLRNPLNVASGRIRLAQQDVENPHLAAANRALDRMSVLIDDLLTLARQGRPIEETERVSIAETATLSWQVIEAPVASLSIEADATLEAVPGRLQQLFENLFRNSVEHGSTDDRDAPRLDDDVEHGGADVTVRVGTLPDQTGFFVEDDGAGIPPEHRDEIFSDGFSTAESGSGLGLSIVSEIVEAHGWTISASNAPSGGARFEISGVESLRSPTGESTTNGSR
jgi:signal transduction histidine kinase